MLVETLERPFRPVELAPTTVRAFALDALAREMATDDERRGEEELSGLALVRDEHLTLVLERVRAGSSLREHDTPAPAAVVLLSGRASFVGEGDGDGIPLAPHTAVAFSHDVRHAVVADEDSVFLIAIGGRRRP